MLLKIDNYIQDNSAIASDNLTTTKKTPVYSCFCAGFYSVLYPSTFDKSTILIGNSILKSHHFVDSQNSTIFPVFFQGFSAEISGSFLLF